MVCRNRTPSEFISYGLCLYFSGLPLRRASERLSCFVKRNHVSIWGLDSETPSSKDINKKKKDLRVCCGWDTNQGWFRMHLALGCCNWAKKQADFGTKHIQRGKHVCCWKAYRWFGQYLWKVYGISRRWTMVSAGLQVPKPKAPHPSPLEKRLIELTMQYIKDRTEGFDDYFPSRIKNCKLNHVKIWLRFFVDYHNNELKRLSEQSLLFKL